MRKVLRFCSFVVLLLALFGFNGGFASASTQDEVKLSEIQQVLLDYFSENGIELQVGTEEYTEYILLQQLENKDEVLSGHPQYELIDYYMGEYLYQLDQNQGENSQDSYQYLEMTIGELKRVIESRELADQEFERELVKAELVQPKFSLMSTYSGTRAAEYARQYATKYNPNYKRYNLDCTNFVSQAVLAGGKTETKPATVSNGILDTRSYWYNDNYYDCTGSNSCYWRDKVSTSWIRVTDFYSYWVNKGMSVTTSTSQATIISNATVGDIIQFKNSSGWFHSVIVNRKANGTVYIASHTSDYYDKDFKNTSELSYRVIKMR